MKFSIAMTVPQFQKWLREARHGERAIYHTGVTLYGHDEIREAVWLAYQNGLVNMFQVRAEDRGEGEARTTTGCHYIAERKR